jgi:SAM-dependent methyltransferase
MKCLLFVAALGLAGCASEEAAPPRPASVNSTLTTLATPAAPATATQLRGPAAPAPRPAPVTAQAVRKDQPAVAPTPEPKTPDVVFVPTPPEVVDKMLELAHVTRDDVVYDLGCGDGRIVVTAAKRYGCRAYGFDVDPRRIQESKDNVEENGVGDLVTIEQKDIFTLDLSPASVVTLYLLPSLNVKLIPQLEKLRPGARIVSHDFDMRGVKPDQVVEVNRDGGYGHMIYLWTTPLKREAPARAP